MSYTKQGILSAAVVLTPLLCGLAGPRSGSRGHWAGPVLGIPALLMGLALVAAVFNNPAGPGILAALLYAPVLLTLGIGSVVRWWRRRTR